MTSLLSDSQRVQILSLEHLLPLAIAVIFAIGLISYAKSLTLRKQQRLVHALALFISLFVITFHILHIIRGDYNFRLDMPLYLCSLLAILIPVYTYYRNYWMFEILVFWIIAGTLQGVITPDIAEGFPSFDYFRYWIVHLGLLTIIFYSIFIFKLKPKLNSVFKSFLALQIYVILMIVVNHLLDANYFYLNRKPKSATILDYFGDWPYYIIVGQLIIIPLFLLIYLPFYVRRKKLLSK